MSTEAENILISFNKAVYSISSESLKNAYKEINNPLKNSIEIWIKFIDALIKEEAIFFSFEKIPEDIFKVFSDKETLVFLEKYIEYGNFKKSLFQSKNSPIQVTLPKQTATILSSSSPGVCPVISPINKNQNSTKLEDVINVSKNLDYYKKTYQTSSVEDSFITKILKSIDKTIFYDTYNHFKNELSKSQNETDFIQKFLLYHESYLMCLDKPKPKHTNKINKF